MLHCAVRPCRLLSLLGEHQRMGLGWRVAVVAVRDDALINNLKPAGGQYLEVALQREVAPVHFDAEEVFCVACFIAAGQRSDQQPAGPQPIVDPPKERLVRRPRCVKDRVETEDSIEAVWAKCDGRHISDDETAGWHSHASAQELLSRDVHADDRVLGNEQSADGKPTATEIEYACASCQPASKLDQQIFVATCASRVKLLRTRIVAVRNEQPVIEGGIGGLHGASIAVCRAIAVSRKAGLSLQAGWREVDA